YSHHYQMAHNQLPRGPSQMHHVLDVLKPQRPDKFHKSLRVSPYTFDKICTELSSDPVFTNNSQNEQIPLADQLAVAQYHFGHDGNGASMQVVGHDSYEKELVKSWVEAHSCRARRNGCLVDGTLIPLYDHPHWYG
ncbi:hypothetical protein DFH29DRAFT_761523, partial [Suillus ampliporus]